MNSTSPHAADPAPDEPVAGTAGVRSALIVASYGYTDPGLTRLRAPVQDAEALAAVLGDPAVGGFEIETVLDAPAHTITRTMEGFFADRSVDDLLLMHYSGHGVKDESGDLYFAAIDTELQYLSATGVSAEFVNRLMNRTRARRVVLLLDCCYAGAFEKGLGTRGDSSLHLEERLGGRGRAVITASSAMEYAFEGLDLDASQEGSPSVFTSALVEGLSSGDADQDQDGMIGLDELYEYVYDAVRRVTPNQTPSKWSLGMQGELYVARRSKPVTTPATLPSDLQEAMESSFSTVRSSAVSELGRLLRGRHAGLSLAARRGLERLTSDDSRSVAAAASGTLAAFPSQRAPELREKFAAEDSVAIAGPTSSAATVAPETVEPSPERDVGPIDHPDPPEPEEAKPSVPVTPTTTMPVVEPQAVTDDEPATPWWRSRFEASRRTGIVVAAVALVVAAGLVYIVSQGSSNSGSLGNSGSSGSGPALSSDEAVVTVGDPSGGGLELVDLRTGRARELVAERASRPNVSPDRQSIIYLLTISGTNRAAHTIGADGGNDRVLFPSGPCAQSTRPAWALDGSRLAVICTGGSAPTLWTSDPDGGSLHEVTIEAITSLNGRLAGSPAWAPYDSRPGVVVGVRSASDDSIDLYWVNPDDPADLHQVTETTGADYDPDWSPEVGKLLFQRNAGATKTVGGSPQTMDSLEAGASPTALSIGEGYSSGSWSQDGTEVVLTRTQDHALMVADVVGDQSPQPVPGFSGEASSLAWSSR